jgi:hypothetical protein
MAEQDTNHTFIPSALPMAPCSLTMLQRIILTTTVLGSLTISFRVQVASGIFI